MREGDLAGQRVLDVGCGTGRFVRTLSERGIAKVWGVEPSPEMLAEARRTVPGAVGLKQGSAERLPFKPGYFDVAVMWTVAHLVHRPRAFAELHRVLAPGGRVAIVTFAPEYFARCWQAHFFPSIVPIDLARHPSREDLERELSAAGFDAPRFVEVHQEGEVEREVALERIHGRAISTFDLLDDDEIRAGTERAERELPERLSYEVDHLLAFALR